MNAMGDEDIEHRLAAATQALHENQLAARRIDEVAARIAGLSKQIDTLTAAVAQEQRDVDKLEGLSLTRVLVSLRGARDDTLARERAEADAARYRLAEAQARLATLNRELDAAHSQRNQLASAPGVYAEVLKEKEAHLRSSGDPRGAQLLTLAEERGRLTAERREISEALNAADAALRALSAVREKLGSASSWSTYDTFFGGGMLSSTIKHHRMDEAAQAAAYADRCIAVLRTELADVGGLGVTAPQLAMDGMVRFVDIWFDNIFTDLAVRNRIEEAKENVARAGRLATDVRERLRQRDEQSRARLGAIDTERAALLTSG
jgi:uncharacterized coiled-coil protein SlyX